MSSDPTPEPTSPSIPEPRTGVRGWLDSRRHRSWLVMALVIAWVVGYGIWRVGLKAALVVAFSSAMFICAGVAAIRWTNRAPRP